MDDLQRKVDEAFKAAFGRTPLGERLKDINREHMELQRYTDIKNMKEETGDLLATLFKLASECGWTVEELINANLDKIKRRMPQYRSLSRKNNVAMYGGSFNPPHVGHLAVAKMILNFSREFDEVWFLPNNNSMDGKDLASAEQRLEMCRLLALHDGRIKVSDYEIVNKFKGETYHMIRRLLEEDFAKDENDFSFVVGMDAAKTLPNWPNSEYLLRMVRFVVVSRPGVEVDMKNAWFLEKPHIYMEYEDDNMRNVSSTDIRNIFKNDGMLSDVEHKLTPEVLEYIRGHCLYRGDS